MRFIHSNNWEMNRLVNLSVAPFLFAVVVHPPQRRGHHFVVLFTGRRRSIRLEQRHLVGEGGRVVESGGIRNPSNQQLLIELLRLNTTKKESESPTWRAPSRGWSGEAPAWYTQKERHWGWGSAVNACERYPRAPDLCPFWNVSKSR